MASITYNAKKNTITVVYDDNFGRVSEENVTVQALDAAFDYFMSNGLSFAEHCEYSAFGKTFRVSLVKDARDNGEKSFENELWEEFYSGTKLLKNLK